MDSFAEPHDEKVLAFVGAGCCELDVAGMSFQHVVILPGSRPRLSVQTSCQVRGGANGCGGELPSLDAKLPETWFWCARSRGLATERTHEPAASDDTGMPSPREGHAFG